jgi:uncharacterized membrane protein
MQRAVRTIIRLVAAGLIVFGGMQAGLEFMRHRVKNAETSPWQYIIGFLLIVLGATLSATSSRIADRLTDESDESNESGDEA